MAFFSLLIWLYSCLLPSLVLAREALSEPPDSTAAVIAANRLLEEELKLAGRPQIYLVLDLASRVIVIKSRGIELHRLAIAEWRQVGEGSLNGVFRLRARPSVTRPKAGPADNASMPTIELQDMPDSYHVVFDPALIISVGQSARERPWSWIKGFVQEWWHHAVSLLGMDGENRETVAVRLHLTLAQETARSLAWTMTDGMPLIIGRTVLP